MSAYFISGRARAIKRGHRQLADQRAASEKADALIKHLEETNEAAKQDAEALDALERRLNNLPEGEQK